MTRRVVVVWFVQRYFAATLLWMTVALATAARGDITITFDADRLAIPGARGFAVTNDSRLLVAVSHQEAGKSQLRVSESRDDGKSFALLPGVIASDELGTDLGDASLLVARDGSLWISYRQNHYSGDILRYSIRVGHSVDGGKSWSVSTVAESVGERGQASRGLWSSCIFERSDGAMQCYFDDEDTAFRGGKPQHQWITMKTWNAAAFAWGKPVVVSRAHDPSKLSRDGMMSVVEVSPMKLLVAFESVATEKPFQNVVRSVTSDNGGATWSWNDREREMIYAAKPPYMALCPWMASLGGEKLICVFCTDEDREKADVSGTPVHRLNDDLKCVVSEDAGKTWSASKPIAVDTHRNYAAGVCVRVIDGKTVVFVTYFDFATGTSKFARGHY